MLYILIYRISFSATKLLHLESMKWRVQKKLTLIVQISAVYHVSFYNDLP